MSTGFVYRLNQVFETLNNSMGAIINEEIITLVVQSQRPLFMFGERIREIGAAKIAEEVCTKSAVSYMIWEPTQGTIPNKKDVDSLVIANTTLQKCDALIMFGIRFNYDELGENILALAPRAKKIYIYDDHNEVNKLRATKMPLYRAFCIDEKVILDGLNNIL